MYICRKTTTSYRGRKVKNGLNCGGAKRTREQIKKNSDAVMCKSVPQTNNKTKTSF